MSGETDLGRLLAGMAPELQPGAYVVVVVPAGRPTPDLDVRATVVEPEGLTVVTTRESADAAGLAHDLVLGWITLRVHSALAAVGLTAAVSTALTRRAISCNVLAGYHHDHLLVPYERRHEALRVLEELGRT